MEYRKSIQYIQTGLIIFFILLVICIFIRPTGLIANSGISYYGVYWNTLIPYTLAFLAVSISTWKSAKTISNDMKINRYVRLALQLFTILFLGILLTPHTVLPYEHVMFGSTLFALQLVLGVILVFVVSRDFWNSILLTTAFLSGVASFIYLNTSHGYMIQAQVIFQIAIWILFIRALLYLESQARLWDMGKTLHLKAKKI
jgi:hypothetical protein